MHKLSKGFLVVEIIPLFIAISLFVIFVKYRAEIVAATVASPIPPIP